MPVTFTSEKVASYINNKKRLEKEIAHYHLDGTVKLRGFVSEPETRFPEFDLLVSCSLYEGMSNVLLEAMAAGLPVAVTDVSGSRDRR